MLGDGVQDGSDEVRAVCGDGLMERHHSEAMLAVHCQYANHLRRKSEQRIFDSADTECVFYSL